MSDVGDLVVASAGVERSPLRGVAGRVLAVRRDAGRQSKRQVCADFAGVLGRGEEYWLDDDLVATVPDLPGRGGR